MIPVNTQPLRTRQEAHAWLKSTGMAITAWARAHGLEPQVVYNLLSGYAAGSRGQSHDAAVLLGMKAGTVGPVAIGPQAGPADKRRRVAPGSSSCHQEQGGFQAVGDCSQR